MKRNRNKIIAWSFIPILLIMVTGGFVGYKLYTKPHRNVEEAMAIKVSATDLVSAYENNEFDANTQYLDKVLEVQGEVDGISKNQKGETVINLKGTAMSGIICTIEGETTPLLNLNSSLVIKGICTGFLTDVVLVRCIVKTI